MVTTPKGYCFIKIGSLFTHVYIYWIYFPYVVYRRCTAQIEQVYFDKFRNFNPIFRYLSKDCINTFLHQFIKGGIRRTYVCCLLLTKSLWRGFISRRVNGHKVDLKISLLREIESSSIGKLLSELLTAEQENITKINKNNCKKKETMTAIVDRQRCSMLRCTATTADLLACECVRVCMCAMLFHILILSALAASLVFTVSQSEIFCERFLSL